MLLVTSLAALGLIEALVDCAADREESVRESIFKSVVDIGRKKHGQVLETVHTYLSKHNKVSVTRHYDDHVKVIYNCMAFNSWLELIGSSLSD